MRRRPFGLETAGPPGRRKKAARLRIEALGDRRLLSTFTVTDPGDTGANTLRQAIIDANSISGSDVIAFAIPGSGVHTITLATPLDPITEAVLIDGTSQPVNGGT